MIPVNRLKWEMWKSAYFTLSKIKICVQLFLNILPLCFLEGSKSHLSLADQLGSQHAVTYKSIGNIPHARLFYPNQTLQMHLVKSMHLMLRNERKMTSRRTEQHSGSWPHTDPTGRSVRRRAGGWAATRATAAEIAPAAGSCSCQGQRASSSQAGLVGAVRVPSLTQPGLRGSQGLGTHTGGTFRPGVGAEWGFPHQLPRNNIFPPYYYSPYYLFAS